MLTRTEVDNLLSRTTLYLQSSLKENQRTFFSEAKNLFNTIKQNPDVMLLSLSLNNYKNLQHIQEIIKNYDLLHSIKMTNLLLQISGTLLFIAAIACLVLSVLTIVTPDIVWSTLCLIMPYQLMFLLNQPQLFALASIASSVGLACLGSLLFAVKLYYSGNPAQLEIITSENFALAEKQVKEVQDWVNHALGIKADTNLQNTTVRESYNYPLTQPAHSVDSAVSQTHAPCPFSHFKYSS